MSRVRLVRGAIAFAVVLGVWWGIALRQKSPTHLVYQFPMAVYDSSLRDASHDGRILLLNSSYYVRPGGALDRRRRDFVLNTRRGEITEVTYPGKRACGFLANGRRVLLADHKTGSLYIATLGKTTCRELYLHPPADPISDVHYHEPSGAVAFVRTKMVQTSPQMACRRDSGVYISSVFQPKREKRLATPAGAYLDVWGWSRDDGLLIVETHSRSGQHVLLFDRKGVLAATHHDVVHLTDLSGDVWGWIQRGATGSRGVVIIKAPLKADQKGTSLPESFWPERLSPDGKRLLGHPSGWVPPTYGAISSVMQFFYSLPERVFRAHLNWTDPGVVHGYYAQTCILDIRTRRRIDLGWTQDCIFTPDSRRLFFAQGRRIWEVRLK